MADVDDFFNKRTKKKKTGKKEKKVVTATDLLKQTEDADEVRTQSESNLFKVSGDQQEDEWIEPVGEQEFVIEGAGIKRLELEQETPVDEKENPSDEERGGEGDKGERGETSWKNTDEPPVQTGHGQMPGQMPGTQLKQNQEKEDSDEKPQSESQKSKYIPPSQRKQQQQTAIKVNEGPYKRREKLNIESAADFPTLGAAADTTPEGFEQVSQKSAGKSWGAGSMAVSASTGISNRFQGLENH